METFYILKNKTIEPKDKDFKEFLPKQYSVEEFFDLYETLFYELSKFHHGVLKDRSIDYIGDPLNTREEELNALMTQWEDLDFKVRSIPKEHSIFKNMSVIQSRENDELLYYIQSNKLRKINNKAVIKKIKRKNGLSESFPNEKFFIKLTQSAIDLFEQSDLDINNESDLTDIRIADLNTPSEPPVEILGQD
tara:strand:+ start:10505 stop:11080 length:576 start_codon:yes stop_codon:yes gene_type:complete